jgi:serine/threonine protein kinase
MVSPVLRRQGAQMSQVVALYWTTDRPIQGNYVVQLEGSLPLQRGLAIARQIAAGLGAAHQAGVVHRDLKPDNVLISSRGSAAEEVKVVDFGLAKVVGASRLTRTGVDFGTPHYMSPEQACGETLANRLAATFTTSITSGVPPLGKGS